MSEDDCRLSRDKKEEQDVLSRVNDLAPLLSLIIQCLELMLRILKIIS